jgi:hypothetical protein
MVRGAMAILEALHGAAPVLLVATVGILAVVLVVRFEYICLSDLASADDSELRYLTRRGWLLLCLIAIPIGGLLYWRFGRDRRFR